MAENTAINNVPICDYVAEFKKYLGKYHQAIQTAKKAEAVRDEQIDALLGKYGDKMAFSFGNYFLKFAENMSEAEKALYSAELKTLHRFKQEVDEANNQMKFYNMACYWSAHWALRQEVKRFFETIIKDDKLMKTKPHHKKFQNFIKQEFPCLALYQNNSGWDFQINIAEADYSFKKNTYYQVYFGIFKEENFQNAFEYYEKFKPNFPLISIEEAIKKFIEAKQAFDELMNETEAKAKKISDLGFGYSVFKQGRIENYQKTIYF